MAKKTYTKMEVRVAARPRSERLRSAGASSTSGNAMSSPALLALKATVGAHVADSGIHVTEDEKTLWNLVASLFGVDEDGNVYVKGDRGFYGTSFISSHGLDPEAGVTGGGLDIDELWSVLGAAGTEKIDASHIPALSQLSGTLGNAQLTNSSVTIAGVAVPLGGALATAAIADALTAAGYKLTDTTYESLKNPYALTINGLSYDGSAAMALSLVDLASAQNISGRKTFSNGLLAGSGGSILTMGYINDNDPAVYSLDGQLHLSTTNSGTDLHVESGGSLLVGVVDDISVTAGSDIDVDTDGDINLTAGAMSLNGDKVITDSMLASDTAAGVVRTGYLDSGAVNLSTLNAAVKVDALGRMYAPLTASAVALMLTAGGYKLTDTNTTYALSKIGSTITLTGSDGSRTSVNDADTTYTLGSFGITATAAELNKLDGLATTATELGYVHGVTSAIQTQLNAKANASALASYALKDGSNASGTWPIGISGNAGTVGGYTAEQVARTMFYLPRVKLADVGWYRVFAVGSNIGDTHGINILLHLSRTFNVYNNEVYTFSIAVAYNGGISITQLAGRANTRLVDKIRVAYEPNVKGVLYVDFHIGISTAGNEYTVSGQGPGTFQTPTPVSEAPANSVEFDTVNGMGSNLGFTGNLTGNATTATNATYANRADYLNSEYSGSGGNQPPSYFNGKGLKVNMMGIPSTYCDVVVVNGYNGYGADVPYINAIAFKKTSGDHGDVWHARGDYGGDSWGTWHKFLDSYNYASVLDSSYVKKSGDTMTGVLTAKVASTHTGIKLGSSYLTAIGDNIVLQNLGALRFGYDVWDYDQWAGLKYHPTNKTIYLGLADGSIFTTNNTAQSGGSICTPGISNIFVGNNTTNKVWHAGNDGSGSGLDADLLDGTHKSGLLTSVASTSAANLSVTVGGTAKVVADLYATYLEGNPATSFDLSTNLGVCQDYGCYVIGLMQITDYTLVGNHANGELILIRQNGNNPTAKIIYSLSTKYNTTDVRFGHLVLGYYSNYVVPCTFIYNGKKWAGFNVTTAASYTNGVVCKRDGLRLGEKSAPFLLKYKVSNTGEVLNSEVNGSLVVNGRDINERGVSTSQFVGPLVGTAESATKLATARTLWGKSFDGTGNVSGDMTGVDWINGGLLVSTFGSNSDGSDTVRLLTNGHNVEFGGPGYSHVIYWLRPKYGSEGSTHASLYIQNASASDSPEFTTTHAFEASGNATHTGLLTKCYLPRDRRHERLVESGQARLRGAARGQQLTQPLMDGGQPQRLGAVAPGDRPDREHHAD